jgi:hypothetical protein
MIKFKLIPTITTHYRNLDLLQLFLSCFFFCIYLNHSLISFSLLCTIIFFLCWSLINNHWIRKERESWIQSAGEDLIPTLWHIFVRKLTKIKFAQPQSMANFNHSSLSLLKNVKINLKRDKRIKTENAKKINWNPKYLNLF